MKSAVIVFPGSNCDRDVAVAIEAVAGGRPDMVWHRDTELPDKLDLIVLPGGFSYGDYLRAGAIAARSPIMNALVAAAERGTSILGICNGFQVLTEIGLLPGALMRNVGQSFICRDAALTVETVETRFTAAYRKGEHIIIPVAHHEGNYFADDQTLDRLESKGQIAFRYVDAVNGSARAIAGVVNERGNVLGMMPHPERAVDRAHGGTDGRRLFASLMEAVAA